MGSLGQAVESNIILRGLTECSMVSACMCELFYLHQSYFAYGREH